MTTAHRAAARGRGPDPAPARSSRRWLERCRVCADPGDPVRDQSGDDSPAGPGDVRRHDDCADGDDRPHAILRSRPATECHPEPSRQRSGVPEHRVGDADPGRVPACSGCDHRCVIACPGQSPRPVSTRKHLRCAGTPVRARRVRVRRADGRVRVDQGGGVEPPPGVGPPRPDSDHCAGRRGRLDACACRRKSLYLGAGHRQPRQRCDGDVAQSPLAPRHTEPRAVGPQGFPGDSRLRQVDSRFVGDWLPRERGRQGSPRVDGLREPAWRVLDCGAFAERR